MMLPVRFAEELQHVHELTLVDVWYGPELQSVILRARESNLSFEVGRGRHAKPDLALCLALLALNKLEVRCRWSQRERSAILAD